MPNEPAPHLHHLELLGAHLSLVTDSADLTRQIESRLGAFLCRQPASRRLEARFAPPPPRMLSSRGLIELSPEAPVQQAFGVIFRELLDAVDRYLILHAAALIKDRRTLLLAGPSGAGKTTLALSLIQGGYRLLSDDFAPLHRTTGLIHPFHKAPGIRPGAAAELAGMDSREEKAGGASLPMDLGTLPPERLAFEPAPLGAVVILTGRRDAPDPRAPFFFSIVFAEEPGAKLAELLRIEGVSLVAREASEIILRIDPEAGAGGAIEEFLARTEGIILEYGTVASVDHDKAGEPLLEPLAGGAALMLLAREIQNRRPGGALLASLGGDAAGLLPELGAVLDERPCFYLLPGDPRATAALVDENFTQALD